MTDDSVPELRIYSLREVLASLKGVCARTALLDRIVKYPEFDGGPTHRRLGRKIVFFPEDLPRLRAMLTYKEPKEPRYVEKPFPSEEKTYKLLQKLLNPVKRPKKRKCAKAKPIVSGPR